MTWVDLFVVALAVLAGIAGWRHGLAVSLLSFLGVLAGALLGVRLAPALAGNIVTPVARVMVSITVVVLLVAAGEAGGVYLGRLVRDRFPGGRARSADSGLGAFVQAFTVVLATWLVALPLASASLAGLSRGVRDSRLLGAMDVLVGASVPSAHELPGRLRAMLTSSGLSSDTRRRARAAAAVGAPDQALAARPAVRAASDSVLKIRGKAHRCQRALEGSGFVIAQNRVATNAHVVAGTDQLQVEVPGSDESLDAKVVLFNPMVDVAILEVPGLKATPLVPAADTARVAADAVELGYPLDGPLTTTPARVRGQIDLSTKDIYNSNTVVRDVYTLRAVVQSGNSGGPLINPDGALYGMIFGTDPDHPDNGYALTIPQIAPMLSSAADLHKAVSTGACGA